MEQAHYRLECLEQVATVTLHLHTLGVPLVILPDVVAELRGFRPVGGFIDPPAVFWQGWKNEFL